MDDAKAKEPSMSMSNVEIPEIVKTVVEYDRAGAGFSGRWQ